MKKIILTTTILVAAFTSICQAQTVSEPRSLPGIDIITRQERGADESLRIWKEGRGGLFTKSEKIKIAENFVFSKYPQDFIIDKEIEKDGDQYLTRALEYSKRKKGIIVHHTASSRAEIEKEGIQQHLRDIYRFHAIKRDRGDIGYNFLIDTEGNIYEGRYGGEGVIGAHARRNNSNTLGVSLIGDYDEKKPTPQQRKSLINLLTQLSLKYDIDPQKQISYHRSSSTSPYIEQHNHGSIVGHRDATNTTCPGKHIYLLLPQLRNDVAKLILMRKNDYRIKEMKNIHEIITIPSSDKDTTTITVPYTGEPVGYCEFVDDKVVEVVSCREKNDTLSLTLRRKQKHTTHHMLRIHDSQGYDTIYNLSLLRKKDISILKKQRIAQHTPSTASTADYPKVTTPISLTQARETTDKDITVLLNDLSKNYLSRSIKCPNCLGKITPTGLTQEDPTDIIMSGDDHYIARGDQPLHVEIRDDQTLSITTQDKGRYASSLSIMALDGQIISFPDYDRTSYAGIGRNRFYSQIDISRQPVAGGTTQFVVTNTLPFKAYIMGIVETNDQEHIEKNKVMAILAKQYAVHYLHQSHQHPNIPDGASYDAIDDPDQFQKYIGAGSEKTLKKRPTAVLETRKDFVLYDNHLAFTPYFSCSPGITLDARHKRGRNDTPYLQPVIDWTATGCTKFSGHGVGLAGQGAQHMAQRGVPYADILEYYYPGTEVR